MSVLWGEIPKEPVADNGFTVQEIEKLTKPKAIEADKGPIFQPSSRHHPPSNEPLPAKWFQIDPITLHTIRLIQHSRKTRQAIQMIQQQQTAPMDGSGDADSAFPVVPPIPENDGPPMKHVPKPPFQYLPPDLDNEFARGIGETPPQIDEATSHKLLRRSVAAILAHMSFEGSPESVLEFLTDVVHEYYLQFTRHLRCAADAAAMHGPTGFPDIMEQVFHEMGIGSVTTLHEFYQTRIVNYHKNMVKTCKRLVAEYEKLKEPMALAAMQSPNTGMVVSQRDTFNVIRIKEEPSADIQLPVLDENDEVTEAEHLLQLDGLSNFEITVEHETAGGLTADVESKWPQSVKTEQEKAKSVDSQDEPVNVTDTSGSVGGQDSVPPTPRTQSDTVADSNNGGQEISAVVTSSPLTPSAAGPSKVKKKKSS